VDAWPQHAFQTIKRTARSISATTASDRFVEAVSDARRNSASTVLMTVKAFAGEPEVLYVALNYANDCGMTVTMAPATGHDEPRP
jgi:hypothetical protein